MMRSVMMLALAISSTTAWFASPVSGETASAANREALAKELRGAWLPLESGITLSRSEGMPISAKYEIDGGTFQLSVYTVNGDHVSEVVVDYSVGTIAKVETLRDSEDLEAADDQKQAMASATRSLDAATADAVQTNPGYRAVSVMPRLQDGRPIAEIALVNGTDWRVVRARLD